MAKTLTIDGVRLRQLEVWPDSAGQWQVFAIYELLSGRAVVREVRRDLALANAPAITSALAALVSGVVAQIQGEDL